MARTLDLRIKSPKNPDFAGFCQTVTRSQAIDQWLDAAEDRLFEAGLADLLAMKAERERGYLPKPAPAP